MKDRRPLLVFFGSQRSGIARKMESVLSGFVQKERRRLRFASVDVDRQPDLAARFEVASAPALVVIRDGRVVDRLDGRVSRTQLVRLLAQHLEAVGPVSLETQNLPGTAA